MHALSRLNDSPLVSLPSIPEGDGELWLPPAPVPPTMGLAPVTCPVPDGDISMPPPLWFLGDDDVELDELWCGDDFAACPVGVVAPLVRPVDISEPLLLLNFLLSAPTPALLLLLLDNFLAFSWLP